MGHDANEQAQAGPLDRHEHLNRARSQIEQGVELVPAACAPLARRHRAENRIARDEPVGARHANRLCKRDERPRDGRGARSPIGDDAAAPTLQQALDRLRSKTEDAPISPVGPLGGRNPVIVAAWKKMSKTTTR